MYAFCREQPNCSASHVMLRPCRWSTSLIRWPICGSSSIVFAFRGALRGGQTKWAEPSVCLLETEGSAKPVQANKQQTIHALRRELFATYFSCTSNLPIFGLENKSVKLNYLYNFFLHTLFWHKNRKKRSTVGRPFRIKHHFIQSDVNSHQLHLFPDTLITSYFFHSLPFFSKLM